MNLTFIDKGFNVVGISIRTTNKEAISKGTIQKLWEKFFAESILSKISHKVDDDIVALYYDYENKREGSYTILLGARVSAVDKLDTDMISQHVPETKRITFASEVGSLHQVAFDLWQEVWSLEDEGELARTYTFDYELYDKRSKDPQKAQMEVSLSIE